MLTTRVAVRRADAPVSVRAGSAGVRLESVGARSGAAGVRRGSEGVRPGAVARKVIARAVVGGAALALLAGCAWFGGGDGTRSVSVFELEPGDCVLSPSDVTIELTELESVDCEIEHHMEVYARVGFPVEADDDDPPFPGDAATKAFADGACAEEFAAYVGVDYRDAPEHLFFTYLVPSARSWSEGSDRTVTCFVTTTGDPLTGSVAGSQS